MKIYAAMALMLISVVNASSANAEGVHVTWAEDLVAHIQPENNEYGSNPTIVEWAGYNGAVNYNNRSVCSTFVTRLLMQSYQLTASDFSAWMGSTSPDSEGYHDAIISENRFVHLLQINQFQVGDIIAIKYLSGSDVSGHTMVIDAIPTQRIASAPIVPGTTQYEVAVIDSSKSGHGSTDTRKMPDGSWDTGAGRGIMRLYVDNNGGIVGHTWSVYSNSTYYDQNIRHVAVGQLAI